MRVERPVRRAPGEGDLLPPGQVSRLRPGVHWGLGLASRSVSFFVWPLTVRIQGNKRLESKQRGHGRASSRLLPG